VNQHASNPLFHNIVPKYLVHVYQLKILFRRKSQRVRVNNQAKKDISTRSILIYSSFFPGSKPMSHHTKKPRSQHTTRRIFVMHFFDTFFLRWKQRKTLAPTPEEALGIKKLPYLMKSPNHLPNEQELQANRVFKELPRNELNN